MQPAAANPDMSSNPYKQHLDKTPANHQPLTPLSFLERAAKVCSQSAPKTKPGSRSLNLTDAMLDELFALLFLGPDGPLLESRMALKPDLSATSHFIDAPRPVLTRQDMMRAGEEGMLAEAERLLVDLPPSRRGEVIDRIAAIIAALQSETANVPDAEPPSLTYTLH